jgi:hypothetical protein
MSYIEIDNKEADRLLLNGAISVYDNNAQEYILAQGQLFLVSGRMTTHLKEENMAKDGNESENI